jgi:hypothetical protein
LDEVAISILNTVDINPPGLPKGVTQYEAEAVIWAGWEFDTFLTGGLGKEAIQAVSHRQSKPRSFSRRAGRDWCEFLIRRTRPPSWDTRNEEEWRSFWDTAPLRISISCHLDGHEPWIVYKQVMVKSPPAEASTDLDGTDQPGA